MNFFEGILYMMWRGLAIGIIISAPMGPVGILCVQRTLEKGRRTGFFTGVGASISDLFYCLVTGFGLSLIEEFLKANQNIIQIVGSVVIAVFGVYLFRSNPSRRLKKPEAVSSSPKKDVMQGFLFTFSNPLIIFLIIGLFARFNFLLPEISFVHLVIGYVFIIIGALGWWWTVSFFVDKVRSHFNLRSMWLINKITGSIIMLFAVVGLFTAISGLASAATPFARYYNSVRGYGDYCGHVPESGAQMLVGAGSGSDTVWFPAGKNLVFELRCAPARNASAWGVALKKEGHSAAFPLRISAGDEDGIYPTVVECMPVFDGAKEARTKVKAAFDPGEWNFLRLAAANGSITLSGGASEASMLLSHPMPEWMPDSVGIFSAGSSMPVDYIAVKSDAEAPVAVSSVDFSNSDARASYFVRSADQIEGEWKIFDRMLDEKLLRCGGDYRLAAARAGKGYDLYYLEGASRAASVWSPGMLKARLLPTGFDGVFDVCWLDAAGSPIDAEVKAQFIAPDIISLRFVDHNSTLRLRKVRN